MPQNGSAQGGSGISAARRAAVDRARKEWIERLIDPSRNNNLLYFRPLQSATIDLTDARDDLVDELLADESIALDHLVGDERQARATAQAKEIRKRAIVNLEERGLETLYAAYGMASWPATDGGRPPEAPILLVPIEIELRGREGRQVSLRRKGDIQTNLVLLHFLEQLGCRIAPDALLEAGTVADRFDPRRVLTKLAAFGSSVPGFEVTSRLVLGNFSFQKMALVKDLRERAEEFAANDLIAAMSGDVDARLTVAGRRSDSSLLVDLGKV